MIPDLAEPSNRYLSLQEREEIAILWEQGESQAEIARRIGRHRSTICRKPMRNRTVRYSGRALTWDGPPGHVPPDTKRGPARLGRRKRAHYRASVAQWKAEQRARRPSRTCASWPLIRSCMPRWPSGGKVDRCAWLAEGPLDAAGAVGRPDLAGTIAVSTWITTGAGLPVLRFCFRDRPGVDG
jgi:hypothetical protein